MSQSLEFNSRRSAVFGRNGIVASSQPLATAAGIKVLQLGGNAADAAIATAAALNVTEPFSTGLGGDAFALYYDAATKSVTSLNGSGRAPDELTLSRLQSEGYGTGLPAGHPHTVTVPGACAAWCDLVERFGRLPLSDTLAPAIQIAEEGFPVAQLTAHHWQQYEEFLRQSPDGVELTINGCGPRPGEIFRNPGLARALQLIAVHGKEIFYHGEIGEAIVTAIQQNGGCMSLEDLAQHKSTWEEPISIIYRNVRVWECPPNGQGITALLALNILDGYDFSTIPPLTGDRLHLQIEAMRLAFADARQYVADPEFSKIPLDELLSKSYADTRGREINPNKAMQGISYGEMASPGDTVYLSVVDGNGNACSFINSTYMSFGSGIVPRGWGFSLQNRGLNFSLQPDHPNVLAPGKRPYHTIIPALATHIGSNELYACFGVMGGFMQPQGHVQVISAMIDDGQGPQSALDQLRFCLENGRPDGTVALEEGMSSQTIAKLTEMGHPITIVRGTKRSLFGRGQIIRREPQTGVLWGGSDPRGDGCAMPAV